MTGALVLRLAFVGSQKSVAPRFGVPALRRLVFQKLSCNLIDSCATPHRRGRSLWPAGVCSALRTYGSGGTPTAEIQVICAYRKPVSNEFLRTHSEGVARKSLHMQAGAIDIRLLGVRTADV